MANILPPTDKDALTTQELWEELCDAGYANDAKKLIRLLDEHPEFDVNDRLGDEDPLLVEIAQEDSRACVQALLKRPGVNPNVRCAFGCTALHSASKPTVIAALLEDKRVDPNIRSHDGLATAISDACLEGEHEKVAAILACARDDVDLSYFDKDAFDKASEKRRARNGLNKGGMLDRADYMVPLATGPWEKEVKAIFRAIDEHGMVPVRKYLRRKVGYPPLPELEIVKDIEIAVPDSDSEEEDDAESGDDDDDKEAPMQSTPKRARVE